MPRFTNWRQRLRHEPQVLSWLAGRGISDPERWHLGYGQPNPHRPPGVVVPVPLDSFRRPATWRLRCWPDLWEAPDGRLVKYLGPQGHPVRLWPLMPRGGLVVLSEGELDCAVAIQNHIRCVAAPGMMVKRELLQELAQSVAEVCVIFDVGAKADAAADRAVALIRDAGGKAWSVRLPLPEEHDDLGDWFTTYHRGHEELLKLIQDARP